MIETTTASVTCQSHHQLMMMRQERLEDNEQQQQQQQQPHHHQHDDQHHHQHQHQHQRHLLNLWNSDTTCSGNGTPRIRSLYRHLIFALSLLLLTVSSAQAQATFLVHPTNRSVSQHRTVVLNCTVANRGAGQVQWTQNDFGMGIDRALPGFDRYSMIGAEHGAVGEYNLQIHDVQLEDEGTYQCQVTPSVGSTGKVSNKVHLEVVVPPRDVYIVKDTRNIPVVLHRPTEILCRADGGKPAPTITWHINGQRVTNGVSTRTRPAGDLVNATGVLIFNATHEDAAKRIECQAISRFMTSPKRVRANLDVQFPPNITMSYNVTSRSIREYDHVRFQCSFFANPSDVTWRWYRNNDLIKGAGGNVLHIHNIDPSYNKDVITCVCTNQIGSSRVDLTLNVQYGPRITHITPYKGADIGQSVELVCEVDGNPAPGVIWRRKLPGSHASPIMVTTSRLKIDVDRQSFGFYQCMASVQGFTDKSKDTVLIQNGPPQALSKKSQEAEEGERATLECEVKSVPEPTGVQWFRHGVPLIGNTLLDDIISLRFVMRKRQTLYRVTYYLTIKKVKAEDFGYYNCTVTNEYGSSMDRILLKEKPALPITYIIVGIILGFAVIFVIILVCVLYRRHFKKDDVGSVLDTPDTATTKTGSYTDTDSSSDKKIRKDADSPSTLMGQLRQGYTKDQYRFSGDYDDMPYKNPATIAAPPTTVTISTAAEPCRKETSSLLSWATNCRKWRKEHVNGNNNGYRYIDTSDTYSDQNIYDGEYIRSDLGHTDRYAEIVPLYSPTAGYTLSSFRGNNYDNGTPPPTMARLTPLHMSNSKLATDV